jgi:hypothetical protein
MARRLPLNRLQPPGCPPIKGAGRGGAGNYIQVSVPLRGYYDRSSENILLGQPFSPTSLNTSRVMLLKRLIQKQIKKAHHTTSNVAVNEQALQ